MSLWSQSLIELMIFIINVQCESKNKHPVKHKTEEDSEGEIERLNQWWRRVSHRRRWNPNWTCGGYVHHETVLMVWYCANSFQKRKDLMFCLHTHKRKTKNFLIKALLRCIPVSTEDTGRSYVCFLWTLTCHQVQWFKFNNQHYGSLVLV